MTRLKTLCVPRATARAAKGAACALCARSTLSPAARRDLSYNALTGTLPAALGQLTQLRRLALGRNLLRGGLPDSLAALAALQSLCVRLRLARALMRAD